LPSCIFQIVKMCPFAISAFSIIRGYCGSMQCALAMLHHVEQVRAGRALNSAEPQVRAVVLFAMN
jgi:hypothetical protein